LIRAQRVFGLNEPANENLTDLAFDAEEGFVYVTGQKTLPGPKSLFRDVFVVRFDADGGNRTAISLGGSEDDYGYSVAANGGAVYVAGVTESADFPVTNTVDTILDGSSDGFVARLNSALEVEWATFLGGSGADAAHGAAIYTPAESNDVFVVGRTTSYDLPGTAQGYFPFYLSGGGDAFISRLQGDTGEVLWSSYHGGTDNDAGSDVIVDEANDVIYIAGKTNVNVWTDGFLFAPAETDNSNGGLQDAFVARILPDGTGFTWSGLLGGTGLEENKGLAVDESGNVLLCGATTSDNFINFVGAWDQIFDGTSDGYLTKMIPPPAP
jgi:hypothetical protein